MTRKILYLILCAALAGTFAHPCRAENETSCLLKVTCDPQIIALNDDSLNILVNSPFLTENFSDDSRIAIKAVYVEDTHSLFNMTVWSSEQEDEQESHDEDADEAETEEIAEPEKNDDETLVEPVEIMREIAEDLSEILEMEYDRYGDELNEKIELIARGAEEDKEKIHHLKRMEKELRNVAGPVPLSREAVESQLHDMYRERQKLEMDLTAMRARRRAMEEHLHVFREKAEAEIREDQITRQLENMIAEHRNMLKHMKQLKESGRAAEHPEISAARQALLNAEIQLQERREELRERAGIEPMGQAAGEMAHFSIETAEKEARLEFLNRNLHEFREKNLPGLIDDYEINVALNLELAKEAYMHKERQLRELRHHKSLLHPPRVTILGNENDEEEDDD